MPRVGEHETDVKKLLFVLVLVLAGASVSQQWGLVPPSVHDRLGELAIGLRSAYVSVQQVACRWLGEKTQLMDGYCR